MKKTFLPLLLAFTGFVIFSCDPHDAYVPVTVPVTPSSITLSGDGDIQNVIINGGMGWIVIEQPEWLTATRTGAFSVSIKAGFHSGAPRTGVVKFVAVNGDKATVTVTQNTSGLIAKWYTSQAAADNEVTTALALEFTASGTVFATSTRLNAGTYTVQDGQITIKKSLVAGGGTSIADYTVSGTQFSYNFDVPISIGGFSIPNPGVLYKK